MNTNAVLRYTADKAEGQQNNDAEDMIKKLLLYQYEMNES